MDFRYLEMFLGAKTFDADTTGVSLTVDLVVVTAVISALLMIAVIVAIRHARRAIVRRSSRDYTKANEAAEDQAHKD